MKRTIKIISVILTVIMFFSVFSAANPVIAAEVQELTTENTVEKAESENITQEDTESESSESEVEILNEIEELRTEDTKYFLQSDGTYLAAQYSEPVHYKNNGKWEEYDFTLAEKGAVLNKSYVAENTDKPTVFPNELKKDASKKISVKVDGYEISFSPKEKQSGLKISNGKITDTQDLTSVKIVESVQKTNDEVSTFELTSTSSKNSYKNNIKTDKKDPTLVNNNKSAVVYEDVFSDVDIEYELSSSTLKESIVLNKKQKKNSFDFVMDLDGLCPKAETDGSIVLYRDTTYTEPVSVIMPPYMFDANGEYSDAVTMALKQDGEEYILTITADEKWLNDEIRAYPVIIDPTIKLDVSRKNTIDCYVDESEPSESFPYDMYLYAGNSTLGNTHSFIKFDLPDLPDECCVIQNVSLNIYQKSVDAGSEKRYISAHRVTESWNNTTNAPTWNDQPNYDDTVLDYAELTYGVGDYYSFDITRAAKSWFENGANNGIMLKGMDETKIGRAQIISAEFNSQEVIYPTVSVTYRNNKGLEGYWSFSSFSAGTGGAGYVNDYSGNLVYEIPLMSTVSEIMPVSLSLVYNGYAAGMVHSSGINGSFRTTPGKGWKFNIQETVISSKEYGLTGETAEQYPFVYTDGDGTEHYFVKTTEKDKNGNEKTVYKDEDGLGLELTDDPDEDVTYQITDKQDNSRYFNSKGNLVSIYNSNRKRMLIKYNDSKDKITSVTDGTNHTLTFDYYGQDDAELDYVLSVKDNAGRTVVLNTASGYLNSVSYYDGTVVTIGYEEVEEGIINYVQTSDGNGLNFNYTSKATGRRVSQVTEYGVTKDTSGKNVIKTGQITTFDRSRYNTTVIRTPGIDGIIYDKRKENDEKNEQAKNDDIVTTLQFDNSGNPTSQQVSYGNGGEVGAGSYNYENNKEGSKNKITDAASLGKNTVNLLKNGNAESHNNWTHNTTGTLTADKYLATGGQYTGKYCLALNTTASSSDGANNYLGQSINGTYTAGYYYTFSAFVKTYGLVQKGSTGYKGAYIQISAYNSSGTNLGNVYSQPLTADTNTDINNGWRRLSATIKLPEGTTSLGAYLCLRNATGKAYFDCMQLELSTTPNSVNLLENSGFESSSSGLPTNWSLAQNTNKETDSDGNVITGISTQNKRQGSNALRISGEADAYKGFYQSIPVEGNENDTYIVSGWAAAFAVNSTFHSHYEVDGEKLTDEEYNTIIQSESQEDDKTLEYVDDSKFEIAVRVTYTKTDEKGETSTVTQYKDPAKFNTTIATWQYAVTPICLKYETTASDKATYTPTHIMIMPRYNLQANYAFFDHLQLIKDVAQSYVYDSEGNLISVTKNAEQKDNITYDGENNVETYTDAIGCKTSFKYETNTHNLQTVTTPKGVQTAYTYDGNGLVTATQTKNAAGKDPDTGTKYNAGIYIIKTGQGYTSNGAHVAYTTDEHGYTTNYTYKNTGVLDSVKYPDETTTDYEYTNNDSKLLSVKSNKTKVVYGYEENKLSNISIGFGDGCSNKETYWLEYDAYGNIVSTKVGSERNSAKVLSTNTYADNNGVLTQTNYGNKDGKIFTYDKSGNVIGIKPIYDGVTNTFNTYLWEYSANGTPRTHTDGKNQLKYTYSYDSIGRLIRQDFEKSKGGAYVGSTEFGYDPRGIQTSIINSIGGKTYSQYYHYYQIKNANGEVVNDSLNNAMDGLPTRYIALGVNTDYTHDSLNRRQKTTVDLERDIVTDYNYNWSARTEGTYHTNQLLSEKIDGTLYKYTYDKVGNITAIAKGGVTYRTYTYDALNQLKSEINHIDEIRTEYEYNHLGNIRFKKIYSTEDNKLQKQTEYKYYTDTDTGWWLDLTEIETIEYNSNGEATKTTKETVNYDTIGNPTTYRNATMSWFGRQLTNYSKGSVTASFTYDADGLRGTKTVNGTDTIYQYIGDKLYYEKRGKKQEFYYFYDSYGKLSSIYYHYDSDDDEYDSSAVYFVTTNSQGDVIGLYNNKGVKVAAYEYDAWGNILSVKDSTGKTITNQDHIANANPFRYRGYYYDADLGLYYVSSRYYDPEIGRFINADTTDILTATPMGLTDKNLFAYCDNNPVMRADHGGDFWHIVAGAAIGGLIGGISSIVGQAISGQKINWAEVGVSAASGALTGAITAACPGMGAVATGIVHGVVGAGTHVATELVNGRTPTVVGTLAAGVTSGVLAGGAKAISNKLTTTKLYRSVSTAEAKSFSSTGKFSAGAGQMEGKFFATTRANAKTWGSKLGSGNIISIRVPNSALSHSSVTYFPRLDAIGPAYYFSDLSYLNSVFR